jgi:hypothetical protein
MYESNHEEKKMKLTEQRIERRRFKRHKVSRRPIAILGPDPVRVGHVTIISDEAAEIQFSETNGKTATKFRELVVLIPEYNSAFLSGNLNIETVSCCEARVNGSRLLSQMRKCVISLSNLNSIKRRNLINACL